MNNLSCNKDKLIQLYKSSKAIALQTEPKYRELSLFKDEIEVTPHKTHKLPFTAARAKVRVYQAVFIGFALLFGILAHFVAVTTLSYPFLFGAGVYFTARNLLVGISLLASVVALCSAAFMTLPREAAGHAYRKALAHLHKHKLRKKMEWNLVEYFQWKVCKKRNFLRDAYQDAQEKLADAHEELIHLLKRVAQSSLSKQEKETLSNQAVLEFSDKGRVIVRTFRKMEPPAPLHEEQ